MKDRIVIDGILYEKVIKSRGELHPEGKFNQIYHYETPKEIYLGILDPKTRNSNFPFLLSVEWNKGSRNQLDRAALSQDGLEGGDDDDIAMNFDLSRRDVSKICRYILDQDLKRTKPWDRSSVEKLRRELYNKYSFVDKDAFIDYYVSPAWWGYMQDTDSTDEYWHDIVMGKDDFSGFDDDYTPDMQSRDEERDYYDLVFGPGNW